MNKDMENKALSPAITTYHLQQLPADLAICEHLARMLCIGLPEAENKMWHGHPVWFIAGNPVAGYSKQKAGMRLMFWSGADFDEKGLNVPGAKFKDASVFYRSVAEINDNDLQRWIEKSRHIQWDYKNIVKRKGKLERIA